jgi:hypothetical protein
MVMMMLLRMLSERGIVNPILLVLVLRMLLVRHESSIRPTSQSMGEPRSWVRRTLSCPCSAGSTRLSP